MTCRLLTLNIIYITLNHSDIWNLVDKLFPIKKYFWGKYKYQHEFKAQLKSFEDFSEWLEEETNSLAGISNPFQKSQVKSLSRKGNVMVSKKSREKIAHYDSIECVFCEEKIIESRNAVNFCNGQS